MTTPHAHLSLVVAGVLIGSLLLGSGCHKLSAGKSGASSAPPPPPVVVTQPAPTTAPVAVTNQPGFFARHFASKPSQPAAGTAAKKVTPPAPPVVETKLAVEAPPPPPVVVTKPAPTTAPVAVTNQPGFFARLFGSSSSAPAAGATAQNPGPRAPVATESGDAKTYVPYRIQVNDTLLVALRSITPEQPNIELVVDENGEIKLPYINSIKAEGRTTSELESLIRDTYITQKIYKRMTVNVIVPAMTQPTFYIKGEVRSPGRLPYVNGMTLLTAIAGAGGPTDFASDNMELLRGGKKIKFNYYDLEKHPEKDQAIQAGDIIIVSKSLF
jgi:polysaccharide export outer membrane protein